MFIQKKRKKFLSVNDSVRLLLTKTPQRYRKGEKSIMDIIHLANHG